ncbi:MAG: AAA family ATPase [Saprospiraceae bacterium]|nr:AAA family ATPase [Saprospiraceae bacterium]
MIISKLKLTNWKNFKSVEIDLASRVFIVGANASGKSNLLDSLRFLRDIVKQSGGLQYAVEDRGGVSKIRCLAARQPSYIEIEIWLSENSEQSAKWKYNLGFKHIGGGFVKSQAIIIKEHVWSRKDQKLILSRSENSTEDIESRKYTFLEQPNANKDFREIHAVINDLQYLNIIPQLVRDASSYFLAKNKEDFFGRNLLDRIARTPQSVRDSYLSKINRVLVLAVPQLNQLSFIKDELGIPHLEAIYTHWRPKAGKQSEDQFSDGTLRLIGFLWALLDGNETVLLEEPELYLHAEIVKQLPEFISKLQKKKSGERQVIITTHSYDLLSNEGIGGNEIIVLINSKDGTLAKLASEVPDINALLKSGFSPAESVIPSVTPPSIKEIKQLDIWD